MIKPYKQINKYVWLLILFFLLNFTATPVEAADVTPDYVIDSVPTIDVWYGLNQKFGVPGIPQRQINILGSTTNADTLEYQLNGGNYITLSKGPDTRRLQNQGDFAVDIFDSELIEGENTVVIVANRGLSDELRKTVTVQYTRTQFWPEDYSVDWNSEDLQSKVQFVDGKWDITPEGIHTTEIGYDRLIAIGDLGWRDYEITVPITMHFKDPAGYEEPSFGPAVGLLFRWSGHTHSPVSCYQPDCGYQPYGAIGWYRWPSDPLLPARLQIDMNTASNATDNSGFQLQFETTYYFKMSVQTLETGRSRYKLKVWPQNISEPISWNLEANDNSERDPTGGSILLLAHHVEATFGDVQITSLSPVVNSDIVSDDFNRCSYDNGLWYWQNPLMDGTITVQNGYTDDARLAITVPQGQNHFIDEDINSVPKVIQEINDGDFQVEIKIDSNLSSTSSSAFPLNGFVIADNDHSKWIQGELRAKLDGIYLVVTSYENLGSSWLTIPWLDTKISTVPISPIKLLVSRYGSRYLVGYQLPNQPWVPRLTFPLHQKVAQTYIYTGNYGGSQAPGHTTLFDYFLNTSNLFTEEDGERNEIISQLIGGGSIIKNPNLTSYSCGQSVELTADPDAGYSFTEWQGALTGTANPSTVVMNGPQNITAHFTIDSYQLNVNKSGTGSGTVISTPTGINCGLDCSEMYEYNTEVTLNAVATAGSTFTGWSGGGCSSTGNCVIKMDEAKTVTASFSRSNLLTVEKIGSGNGTVISDPAGIDCGDTCVANFANGLNVSLTAVADSGSKFAGWSATECPGLGTCEITIDSAKTIIATFSEEFYEIEMNILGSGKVNINPLKTYYAFGDNVILEAIPEAGWFFEEWVNSEFGSSNRIEIKVSKDYSLTALFSQRRIYLPLIIK